MRIAIRPILFLIGTAGLSLILSWVTYLQPGSHLVPGLDSAYAYGFNYAFLNNLIMGRDIIFTFGPLGFFEHTRLLANSMMYLSSGFWFVVSVCLNVCLLIFGWQSSNRWPARLVNLAACLMLIFVTYPHIQRLLLIPSICLFLHWRTRSVGYLLLFALAAVTCLLIKFSYGVAAFALFFPYLLLLILQHRPLYEPVLGMVAAVISYIGLWFVIYGQLTGSLDYLHAGLQFAQGSSTAMAVNPDNNWIAIACVFASLLASLTLICRELRYGIFAVPLAFLGPMYIWTKYAFGVEDPAHLAFLMAWIFYVVMIWFIAAQTTIYKAVHIILLACAFFAWTKMHTAEIGEPDYSFSPHFGFANQAEFSDPRQIKHTLWVWRDVEPERIKSLLLPENIRKTIGDSTVDIYPWETIIAAANHLNLKPRPVFQNYITYTPYLDAKNQTYLSGENAPEFIIWHKHSFQDIGTRYPFNTDPLTLTAILSHYLPIECAEKFCLWKRALRDQAISVLSDNAFEFPWDEWVAIPDMKADVIKAHIAVKRNVLGKMNLLAWKEGGIEIDYRLLDGSIKTHELPPDNAVSGVWVSPYLQEITARPVAHELTQDEVKTMLAALPGKGYFDKMEKSAVGLHVAGWCLLPFESTENQKLSVLFYNEKHAYRIPVISRERRDVTDSLNMRGVVDLDMSGFDHDIMTRSMAPGNYRLRVLVDNKGKTAIAPDQNIHFNVSPQVNTGNVEAIRIRTTRPWAFTDTLTLNWEVVQFTGKTPW